jgi:hypothetical protein
MRRSSLLAGTILASCAVASQGADRPPTKAESKTVAADLEFLEYLGTFENDEDNWTDVVKMELPTPANTVAGKNAAASARDKPKAETAPKSADSVK